jgi:hypothetical protein
MGSEWVPGGGRGRPTWWHTRTTTTPCGTCAARPWVTTLLRRRTTARRACGPWTRQTRCASWRVTSATWIAYVGIPTATISPPAPPTRRCVLLRLDLEEHSPSGASPERETPERLSFHLSLTYSLYRRSAAVRRRLSADACWCTTIPTPSHLPGAVMGCTDWRMCAAVHGSPHHHLQPGDEPRRAHYGVRRGGRHRAAVGPGLQPQTGRVEWAHRRRVGRSV